MKNLAQLSPEDFTKLLDGYYAAKEQRHNMTEAEVNAMATRLNEIKDIPFIGEGTEQRIFVKIVLKVDNFLYDNLPNEIYDLVRDADKGISAQEARKLIRRLTQLANKKLDIPYVPENIEKIIYRLVISTIINAARKGSIFSDEATRSHNLEFAEEER